MDYSFHDWFVCPECETESDVTVLAHGTEMVFECYECGQISEFEIGADVPLRDLDADAVSERVDEGA